MIFRGSISPTEFEYKSDIDGISWRGAKRVAFIPFNFVKSTFLFCDKYLFAVSYN